MFRSRLRLLAALLSIFALTAACGSDGTPTDTAEAPQDEATTEEGPLVIGATEYAFSVPETLPAGDTTFVMENNGDEPHMLIIAELKEDAPPVEELIKLKSADKFLERELVESDPVKPGDESKTFDEELTPGRYGYVCFFSKKGEKPHAFLGMLGEFTVE